MTLVKICGITNIEDALVAAECGADQIGLNFYRKSARYVEVHAAREISQNLPKTVEVVGVFVNANPDFVRETALFTNLHAIQLHGDETPEYASSLRDTTGLKIIKAFRTSPKFTLDAVKNFDVNAVLLDAYANGEYGGTGEVFDWEIAVRLRRSVAAMYLAGGLSELNVAAAIDRVHPFCVDACSALESSPGVKDEIKLRAFLRNAGKNL